MEKLVRIKETLKLGLIYMVCVKKSRHIKGTEFDWM